MCYNKIVNDMSSEFKEIGKLYLIDHRTLKLYILPLGGRDTEKLAVMSLSPLSHLVIIH